MTRSKPITILLLLLVSLAAVGGSASAQTPVMPLGDSITQGGQGYASYRYQLWFDLLADGYDVDFVGQYDELFGGGSPFAVWYPDYFTTFDRDHEGYWGWRTDQILSVISAVTTANQPDIVLLHLGTNDVGQNGAVGVTNANLSLRAIIGEMRAVRPNVTVLLGRVIPIGTGSDYDTNAVFIDALNTVIDSIAADSTTAQSPIILVDHHTGYDLGTMMQSDGLHPNLVGESFIAANWKAALEALLPVVNSPPTAAMTVPESDTVLVAPADIILRATASDSDGTISEVRFYDGASLLGTDTTSPYTFLWFGPSTGTHTVTAVAVDDGGALGTSPPIEFTVLSPGNGIPIPVADPSFEDTLLADSLLAEGPGTIGGWTFSGTLDTYVGVFNPPAESYPTAGGNGTPTGADSSNVAYLFNNGGQTDSVSAVQVLGDSLLAATEYTLTVAIGNFLADQPYAFSTYGGYRIQLLAGSTVIAEDVDSVVPVEGEFADAFVVVYSDSLDPGLVGQPLAIRLDISATDAPRSTHFDNVRLARKPSYTTGIPTRTRPPAPLLAYPNPFSDRTRIAVPQASGLGGPVVVTVFDVSGRRIRRLAPAPGETVLWWDGRTDQGLSVPAGVYFLRAVVGGEALRARIVKTR